MMNPSFVLAIGCCVFLLMSPTLAQEPAVKPAKNASQPSVSKHSSADAGDDASEDELLDGLLDLIPGETSPRQGVSPELSPVDVGLTDEEVEQASGPLEPIRQSMLISAGLLRRGDNEVAKLQTDILSRLDDLISQLESSRPSDSRPDSAQTQTQQGQSQQSSADPTGQKNEQAGKDGRSKRGPPADDSASNSSGTGSVAESGDGNSQENASRRSGDEEAGRESNGDDLAGRPSDRGPQGAAKVRMKAPQAYQQTVWGLLPDRVRESMQSRMVEQFLPTHREQIEVYYQKLLERYRENE